jgi:hypothetical protein
MRTDRQTQTDTTKLIVAFRYTAKAPKIALKCIPDDAIGTVPKLRPGHLTNCRSILCRDKSLFVSSAKHPQDTHVLLHDPK